jgi:hypothetical protein
VVYLPHEPRNFREIVIADLLRAQRLILRIQDQIDPQFRIASPEGDWWIGMTLSDDPDERERQFRHISNFMRWKQSPAFTLASELIAPDAVYCISISTNECHAAMSRIRRNPIRFREMEWLSRTQIGDAYPSLLPRDQRELSRSEIADLVAWFGPDGRFPAVRINAG